MSIDSAFKRVAMLSVAGAPVVYGHLPVVTGDIPAIERAQLLHLYGGNAFQGVAAPVFSGTIPNITGDEGDADIVTDLSAYFSDATSYSIAPAVEAGWNFDTITGILTVDTDEVNSFGPYTVTGTNASGSDDSNAFSVIISTVVAEDDQPSGGYFWFRYEQEQFKREEERKLREKAKRKAKQIKDKLDRELALEERKIEEKESRNAELARISRLVANNKKTIIEFENPVIIKAMDEAIERQTFSTMERLERLLANQLEEEQFMAMAIQILVNQ